MLKSLIYYMICGIKLENMDLKHYFPLLWKFLIFNEKFSNYILRKITIFFKMAKFLYMAKVGSQNYIKMLNFFFLSYFIDS